jgi:hypothetical protein
MIQTAIRCPDDTVMVFDEEGKFLPGFQGNYENVKQTIFNNAQPNTLFSHYYDFESVLVYTPRESW